MRVLRLGFVATRTGDTAAMTSFFRDVLGLESVRDTPEWSILRLPTGEHDYAEVFGAEFDDERLCPSDAGLMIAFVVDDLDGAHAEVVGAGLQASAVVWAAQEFNSPDLDGFGWFFVKAPDGNTYVIQQAPESGASEIP